MGSRRCRALARGAFATAFASLMVSFSGCFDADDFPGPRWLYHVDAVSAPVGDPESSRIDPALSGYWVVTDGSVQDDEHYPSLWLLEPVGSRAWLVSWFVFTDGRPPVVQPEDELPAPASPDGAGPVAEDARAAAANGALVDNAASGGGSEAEDQDVEIVVTRPSDSEKKAAELAYLEHVIATLRDGRAELRLAIVHKAWLAGIGGERFLVLEPKLVSFVVQEDAGLGRPDFGWLLARVTGKGDRLVLSSPKAKYYGLDEITSRRDAERVIARHAREERFYADAFALHRLPASAQDAVREAVQGPFARY